MYVDPGWYLKGNTFALRFGVVAEDAERFPDVHALLSASLEDTVTMCGSFRSFESAWVSLWWNPKPIISCRPFSSGSSSVCAQSCHICPWKDCQQQYGSPKRLDFRTFIQQKTVFFWLLQTSLYMLRTWKPALMRFDLQPPWWCSNISEIHSHSCCRADLRSTGSGAGCDVKAKAHFSFFSGETEDLSQTSKGNRAEAGILHGSCWSEFPGPNLSPRQQLDS